ncbi:hypothetical protein [Rhizobium binae]|uniref:hypothetical protein n=1 Tax=Rhizobium binae TaxID=1138190 RepID=UPI001C82AF2A|nr:hypothetical protein [Rhizobium binae]MBX4967844.1 hypothetical protein [Rhizobium binae]
MKVWLLFEATRISLARGRIHTIMFRLVVGTSLDIVAALCLWLKGCDLGPFYDFAIDIEHLEFLEAILVETCNELKVSPEQQGFGTRVADMRSHGHSREEILRTLRVEFASLADRRQDHASIDP